VDWLTCDRLWWHAGQEKGADPKADYRRYIEDYLHQGMEEGVFERLTAALAIGGTAFIERLRRKVPKRGRGDECALLAQAACRLPNGSGRLNPSGVNAEMSSFRLQTWPCAAYRAYEVQTDAEGTRQRGGGHVCCGCRQGLRADA